ncbi:hypothetical protein D3C76_1578590 [compost metagenome]
MEGAVSLFLVLYVDRTLLLVHGLDQLPFFLQRTSDNRALPSTARGEKGAGQGFRQKHPGEFCALPALLAVD